jgi:6-phosphogluconolactonase
MFVSTLFSRCARALAIGLTLVCSAVASAADRYHFVYTLNNDVADNGVVVYYRQTDGSLRELAGSPFSTGGKGLSGGDIDEQGAIRIHGQFLLAVNPGSDSISVFRRAVDGRPTPVSGSP